MLSASKSGSGLATGYNLTRSLRFRASASAYLNRTNTSTVTNNAVWTWSGWAKLGYWSSGNAATLFGTGAGGSANESSIKYVNNQLNVINYVGSSVKCRYITTAVYRDPSAWYHVVVSSNSSTSLRIYINGVQVTAFDTATAPDASAWGVNTASTASYMGWLSGNAYFDGYLAEVNFIDGQALTPSSFGSTNALTGVWQPARYTGTYGTNGFYLPFTDNSALTTSSNVGLGRDYSGNGNYWTTNNISITAGTTYDSMTDVPTLTSATAANFAVANPVDQYLCSITQGNLSVATNNGGYGGGVRSTIAVSSGKWYWESVITVLGGTAGQAPVVGIIPPTTPINAISSNTRYAYYGANGNKLSSAGSVAYGATFSTGDVIGYALDLDAGTLTFYKNNTSQGTAFTGLSGSFCAAVYDPSTGGTTAINFGQRPFSYTPPTGFVALCTYNLPTSTIVKGNTVMDATLYTGAGNTSSSFTNAAAFKPDLVWTKARSIGYSNYLYDSVRGTGTTKSLVSNTTNAEGADATNANLTAFNSNGWSIGSTSGTNALNDSGQTFVAWQWQAGQGSTSSNTNGSITSTVSVNASAGFSVVTYTGTGANATVGHGLGVAPAMMIFKDRTIASTWLVYHQNMAASPAQGYLTLNGTNAYAALSNIFNNTAPTSSVISIGTNASINTNGNAYVAYCWTPIAGYSAFGSYTGNGSSDGPFVYTGFKPRFILIKSASTAEYWRINDTARNPYDISGNLLDLYPNTSDAEAAGSVYDFLSNGFKIRQSGSGLNGSGNTYIYAAFASNPFRNSLAQ